MTCFTRRSVIGVAILALLASQATATSILVCSKNNSQILQYNAETGAFEGVFADAATLGTDPEGGNLLNEPTGMKVGLDGNIYVAYRDDISNADTGGILSFAPDGTYLGVYSTAVRNVSDLTIDNDGNLLACKRNTCVYRILGPDDPNAGELDPAFTPYPAAVINSVEPVPAEYTTTGLPEFFRAISHDGGQVRRATGDTGDTGSYSLDIYAGFKEDPGAPYVLEMGLDGKLYAMTNAGPPNEYATSLWSLDLAGGATEFTKAIDFLEVADPLIAMPLGLCFLDETTALVSNYHDEDADNGIPAYYAIAKFNVATGEYLGELVSNGDGGLSGPHYGLVVLPEGGGPVELEGDLNNDGLVGSADLDIVRGAWGQFVSGAAQGDPSGDGIVGSADLDIVRANWGQTAAASVPEPGTLALLIAGLAGILVYRRK